MSEITEAKKQVLVRLPETTYTRLLAKSAQETVKRGKPVSVPTLIAEQVERSLNEGKEDLHG